MVTKRKIVNIDETKCNGCGRCVTACAEGAIEIVDGKARLVSETYCDGLGACLGECPQEAIIIEEREAEAFDAEAVEKHLGGLHASAHAEPDTLACGCPSTTSQILERSESAAVASVESIPSQLGNWPVQLRLAPPTASYLPGARLLISADCVPFAFADFHRTLLSGRVLLVGCPKLDDTAFYREKLAQILRENEVESVDVAYMEVPCCFGLVNLVRQAVELSGRRIPVAVTKVSIRGEIAETHPTAAGAAAMTTLE